MSAMANAFLIGQQIRSPNERCTLVGKFDIIVDAEYHYHEAINLKWQLIRNTEFD